MNASPLKQMIRDRIWQIVDEQPGVQSATLTGSFVDETSLDGMSDIDLVLILDRLDQARYDHILRMFDTSLRPALRRLGCRFRINSTLGPLKWNDPFTVVLHLMLYTPSAHVEHALTSPFTCFDWQRSTLVRKQALAEVYPVFGLQPRHFLDARRSINDYLKDFHAGTLSYREITCTKNDYREVTRHKQMTVRDQHEFAYHVTRFLMQNLVKLVRRSNHASHGPQLLHDFFAIFPNGAAEFGQFFEQLQTRKRALSFDPPVADLKTRLVNFASEFERQFRQMFIASATHHIVFRHAHTLSNRGAGAQAVFVGSSDPPIGSTSGFAFAAVRQAVSEIGPTKAYCSPARRCRESFDQLAGRIALPAVEVDERLREIDYGTCEGLTVLQVRQRHPELFAAWNRGEDPRFPGGENVADVANRVGAFIMDRWQSSAPSMTCTHNCVLRWLIGEMLRMPPRQRWRLRVPHLQPVTFIQTRDHGLFVNIPEPAERELFADFAPRAQEWTECKSSSPWPAADSAFATQATPCPSR